MSMITEHLPRIRALLGVADSTDETAPEPAVESAGALDAVAYSWPGGATVTVFLYADYADAEDAFRRLWSEVDHDTTSVEWSINGPLLMWSTNPPDQSHVVAGLGSAFAGRE